ncbi:MAG TPA: alcohol dehydrogenase catalytic domain-containing protein [Firmicutes bacterium]|nr:zinc-binding dehydrogenase [Bacillota bacterium]HHY98577.1 alcohol dehydrogenase catalytic domain-containing protein [Bacillota bacterium]
MKGLMKLDMAPGNMEIREVSVPSPGPGEVLIEVKAAGICGSDIHIYHSDIKIPLRPPVITGHEFSGVIAAVGEGVSGWEIGERVTSETAVIYCGKCLYCRTGFYNLCPERRTLGYWVNGAFAPYTVVPASRLHRLPENISFEEGAMTEPLACVVHAVNELTSIKAGDVVAVVGPGPIGLLALQLSRLEGADVIVFGTSTDEARLKMAKELGALETASIQDVDAIGFMGKITGGLGADVVLECSGSAGGTALGLDLVRRMGQFTQIGLHGKRIEVDFERICYKELKVTGSLGSIWSSWEKALKFMEDGGVQLKPLIGDILSLTDWQEGFKRFEEKRGLKIIFRP